MLIVRRPEGAAGPGCGTSRHQIDQQPGWPCSRFSASGCGNTPAWTPSRANTSSGSGMASRDSASRSTATRRGSSPPSGAAPASAELAWATPGQLNEYPLSKARGASWRSSRPCKTGLLPWSAPALRHNPYVTSVASPRGYLNDKRARGKPTRYLNTQLAGKPTRLSE